MVDERAENYDESFVIRRAKLIFDKIPIKVKEEQKITEDSFIKVKLTNPIPELSYERLDVLPSEEYMRIFRETGLSNIDVDDEEE